MFIFFSPTGNILTSFFKTTLTQFNTLQAQKPATATTAAGSSTPVTSVPPQAGGYQGATVYPSPATPVPSQYPQPYAPQQPQQQYPPQQYALNRVFCFLFILWISLLVGNILLNIFFFSFLFSFSLLLLLPHHLIPIAEPILHSSLILLWTIVRWFPTTTTALPVSVKSFSMLTAVTKV